MARTKLPHGDGSLFFRKDRGLWIGRVELGYLPNGKRERVEVSGKTKAEVLEKMKKARSKKDAGLIQTPARLTVAAHLEAWIAATELSGTVKPSTVETYRGVITRQLTPALGRIPLDKLQPAHVENMLSDMRRSLSPATCGLAHATLRRALSEAVRKGYLMRNVASLVRGPRVVNTKPTEVLSPSEAAALMAGAEGTWLEVFVLLGLMLALRPGESLALRWEDVSFDTGMLSVNGTLGRLRGQGMVRTAPKNEHSRRNLPMPETLVAALRAQRVRQLEEKMANRARWTDSGYVLTNSFGRPLDTKHLSVSFRRLVTHTLGAESTVRCHGLRHSAATFALTGGAPLKYVSDLLGHSSIAVTSAVYIHLKPEHMVDTARLLERTVLEARKATGTDGVGTVAR